MAPTSKPRSNWYPRVVSQRAPALPWVFCCHSFSPAYPLRCIRCNAHLPQAESVEQLIAARTSAAADGALSALRGEGPAAAARAARQRCISILAEVGHARHPLTNPYLS